MRTVLVIAGVLAIGVCGAMCGQEPEPAPPDAPVANAVAAHKPVPGEVFELLKAKEKGSVSLEEVLAKRRSVRSFRDEDLSMEAKGQLLWAAQGVTSERGFRTAPSAGATYPLEVYLVDRAVVYKYAPSSHSIKAVKVGDMRGELSAACMGQRSVAEAGVVFVFGAVFERTMGRYRARADRYVYVEAGHAGQNVLLEAVALGLGAVPVGAYDDAKVKEVVGMPEEEEAVYVIPVGVPR